MWLVNPYRFAVAAVGYDSDAQAYITAVESADGQPLETGVRDAINAFVVGCKADGIWNAIKASCILAGARTLQGALVPLVGTAPTTFGTVGGWNYDRKTGLQGNGTDNYLNANRLGNADPLNSYHLSAYISSQLVGFVIGSSPTEATVPASGMAPGAAANTFRFRSRYEGAAETDFGNRSNLGFIGHTRSNSTSFTARTGGANTPITLTSSDGQATGNVFNSTFIFRRPFNASPAYSTTRLSFYSIGENLNLALLDARLTALMNAFAAAIS